VERRLDLAQEGARLVSAWRSASSRVEAAHSELNRATCEIANAQQAVVNWLVPKTAHIGDCYCLPIGDSFLELRVVGDSSRGVGEMPAVHKSYLINWRDGREPTKHPGETF
jgi:hypothetical protein